MAEPQEEIYTTTYVKPQNGDRLNGCIHYWKVESDAGGQNSWEGVCIKCGEGRTFYYLEPTYRTARIPCPKCQKGMLYPKSDSLVGSYYQCGRCKAQFA